MTGCHSDIALLFLLAGHTKFGPDWCLGLFKRRFHRTRVDCLADIVQVTTAALSTGILTPQLGSDEAGNVLVPSRDWMAFLSEWFQKLVGLKKFHHFQFKASGEVLCCENGASEVMIFSLLKGPAALPDTLPTIVQPSGLSQQRKGYLFQEIQEFVDQDYQDLVCPESPQSFTKAPAPPAPEDPAKPSTSAATSTATTRTPGRPKKQHQEAWLPRGSDWTIWRQENCKYHMCVCVFVGGTFELLLRFVLKVGFYVMKWNVTYKCACVCWTLTLHCLSLRHRTVFYIGTLLI